MKIFKQLLYTVGPTLLAVIVISLMILAIIYKPVIILIFCISTAGCILIWLILTIVMDNFKKRWKQYQVQQSHDAFTKHREE